MDEDSVVTPASQERYFMNVTVYSAQIYTTSVPVKVNSASYEGRITFQFGLMFTVIYTVAGAYLICGKQNEIITTQLSLSTAISNIYGASQLLTVKFGKIKSVISDEINELVSDDDITINVSSKHPYVQPVVVNVPHSIKYKGATNSWVFLDLNHFNKNNFNITIYTLKIHRYIAEIFIDMYR
eukprot:121510_1